MKIKFALALLLTLCGLNAFATVTGETPVTGSSYYLYNVGQQKYLTVSGSAVVLSTSGTQFTVAAGTTSGTYTLTASAKLTSNFNGDIICSDDGYYTDWKFTLLSSTDNTYALGILEDEDAYSFSYIYYSDVLSGIAKCFAMPELANGQWMFTTSGTQTTYTVTVTPLEDLLWNATSATVNYTVTSSTGEVYNCTHDVTFEANTENQEVTRSGKFTDTTYGVEVSWSVKLGVKPEASKTVTLYQNETSYSTPEDIASSVDVYLYRSMEAGKKNSFCVPFDMTDEQLQSAFGSSYSLYEYRSYNSTSNRVYYSSVKEVEAGVPYVVIPDATSTESSEETAAREANTDLSDTEARLYIIKGVSSSSFVSAAKTTTHGAYDLIGTFVDETISAIFYAFDETSGTLKKAASDRELKGFRAYFKSNIAGAKDLTDVCFDDDVDGIATITSESSDTTPIYNLNGQMVKTSGQSTENLTPGIYIINGKKLIIK